MFRGDSLVYAVTRAQELTSEIWRALPDGREPTRVAAGFTVLNASADGSLAAGARADGGTPFVEIWDVASGAMQTRIDGAWLTVR